MDDRQNLIWLYAVPLFLLKNKKRQNIVYLRIAVANLSHEDCIAYDRTE